MTDEIAHPEPGPPAVPASPPPTGPVAPAAWQPDPSGRFKLRYWDGTAWTEHVSTNGVQQTDPVERPPVEQPASVPAATPARPRGRVVWPMRTRGVVLGGAALLLLGSVLPWAKAEATFAGRTFSHTTNGLDGDGVITLVLAVTAALVFLFVPRAKVTGALVLVAGVLAGLVAVIDIADVGNKADDLRQFTSRADATVGIGLWIVAVAAVVLIVGAVLCLREPEPAAPPAA